MKKKVLFVNGHLNVGGVEKSLMDILRHMDYEKYDVDLILFEELGDYYNELPKEVNVRFIDITNTYGSTINCLKKALKNRDIFSFLMKILLTFSSKINYKFYRLASPLLKINKAYDCAIAFRVGFCAEIVALCVNSKKKVVWWHHGECNYLEKDKKRMIKIFDYFDKVVSVSEGCKNMIENYFGNLNSKTIVIPNMIDTAQIRFKAKQFKPYIDENEIFKIITVGRLSPEKNMKNIVNIAKELVKKNFIKFKWHIVGDGIEYYNIENLIRTNKLDNYIQLEGSKVNPYPYIYYADIMVHTSLVESQCLTVLEGMTLLKPCVVSKSIGPQEFIINNVNGVLTSHQPKEIADKIINVFNDKDLFELIKRNSFNTIKENYSIKYIMKKIELLIDGR